MYDLFYIDVKPEEYPQAQKVSSIEEAREKSRTRFCWILDGRNDYNDFDLLWEPYHWEEHHIHVWPSQHQQNGGTYLVPKIETSDINYDNKQVIPRTGPSTLAIFIDHGNERRFIDEVRTIADVKARFINDYLGTLKRVIRKIEDVKHVWVTSSLCDYHGFDFSWHPSEWQQDMMHVFPSNEQKFGDTFYINVEHFKEQSKHLELLEWYDTICFQETPVRRLPMPIYLHSHDNHPDAVIESTFVGIEDPDAFKDPLTIFATSIEHMDDDIRPPAINMWRPETRTITPLDRGAQRVIIPKEALPQIKNELYDYPYIDTSFNETYECKPLDIIFMSNGEECAEKHYKHLLAQTCDKNNFLKWVSNVEGRIASAREAARQSTTDWFFSVNAKLKVDVNFDWDWQPDRMQAKKHYIFYAYNPYTNDTYGHMAMIAWNKDLVMTDTEWGLDFTMSHPHEVVPILSGEAVYGDSDWDAWRTAFREVIKLMVSNTCESQERLQKWKNSRHNATAQGAYDALRYYTEVDGDMGKLMLSFDWAWLYGHYRGAK